MSLSEKYFIRCQDADTEWCPCVLADSGSCPVCPVIRGADSCTECVWHGVCIYEKCLSTGGRIAQRKFHQLQINHKTEIGPDMHRVCLTMPPMWRFELSKPGGFIIVKPTGAAQYYGAPMAVYQVNGAREMSVVFEVRGPKTSRLVREDQAWDVKGPFSSGLWGAERLGRTKDSRCLVIATGTGQSLLPAVVGQLIRQGNDLHLVVETKNSGMVYAVEDLAGLHGGGSSLSVQLVVSCAEGEIHSSLKDVLRQQSYEMIISLGSDYLHEQVAQLRDGQPWTASNNSIMVCGEGICGSCGVIVEDGEEIRGCKADIPPEIVFGSAHTHSKTGGG